MIFIFVIIEISNHSLNGIRNKKVGNGQHGTARFANRKEIKTAYKQVEFDVANWRKGVNLPTLQGIVLGTEKGIADDKPTALVDDTDVHTLMIGASGVGKTTCFIYPNIEYCCAAGLSYITTDSKGDLYRNTAEIAKKYYGYNIAVIDLRNPTRSDSYNMLFLVNKYMDLYLQTDKLSHRAKAEKYAKITAKTIVSAGIDIASMGQNSFFYEAAEGLITSIILIVSEFCNNEQRHIISVLKLLQELLAPTEIKGKSELHLLIEKLPTEHKARWFAGAATSSAGQALSSIISTAMSRLNAFLDSEMEQILCFETSIDVEKFCAEKTAVYLVLPEEDITKHFLVSLILQQIYREMLTVADENGGALKNRAMIFADEIGTLPKIDGLEMMFSASRSRKISIVAIIQSIAQFEKTYGNSGAEIVIDNCQNTIFGNFAPNSKTAETISKNLGSQTILSGSVSIGDKNSSKSLQMIERPLMTVDELKKLPKFHFIVMKTGFYPMRTRLDLFFKWGIVFENPYTVSEKSGRAVAYASKDEIAHEIMKKYGFPAQEQGEPHRVNLKIIPADGSDVYADET
jgi:type IV secretion system protein VirD4